MTHNAAKTNVYCTTTLDVNIIYEHKFSEYSRYIRDDTTFRNNFQILIPYGFTTILTTELCSETKRVMTTLILGIGVGLFVILTLWLSAALIFTVSLRIDKKIGAIVVIATAIITLILVSVPRSSENPTLHQEKPYDQLFIWRVILLTILAGSSLIALIGYVKYELMECTKPQRITNWIY